MARPYIFKAIFDHLSGQLAEQVSAIAGSKLLSIFIDKIIEKAFERKINTVDSINNSESFVILLENIIKCEKHGDSLPFEAFKEYVKIDIYLNNLNKSLLIYSVDPFDHKKEINYSE
jgi:hypothetical protein